MNEFLEKLGRARGTSLMQAAQPKRLQFLREWRLALSEIVKSDPAAQQTRQMLEHIDAEIADAEKNIGKIFG